MHPATDLSPLMPGNRLPGPVALCVSFIFHAHVYYVCVCLYIHTSVCVCVSTQEGFQRPSSMSLDKYTIYDIIDAVGGNV